jgi:hypothetical protein
MSHDSTYVVHSLLADKLHGLAKQAAWLVGLAQHLRDAVDETGEVLRSVELTPPEPNRDVAGRWLATAANRELREALIAARGHRGTAVLRTKLNADLEQRHGRRHPINGSPRVNGNGSAAHA